METTWAALGSLGLPGTVDLKTSGSARCMLANLWLTQTHRITYNHIENEDDNDDDNDDNNERDGDNDDDYVKDNDDIDNDDSGKVIFMMVYIIITKTIFDELYKHNE